ncbi:ABC transporter ATP-binding protein [Bacillus sp. PS06]|uniref:ABC transporter ATP-binding protein n=1 Tax=Bacillus sp. PS06 TaxID=2764176 RepID=UPI001783D704|nr:ABC transporter ATP-binding protein [Bacillus sp. PS06]MBD8069091.1 ABC transporter ATP-binding protein [Bacillus sp. PS06]
MSNSELFIRVEQVSFSFKEQQIIYGMNLSLTKGTSYALIGKSGTGKSTFLNLVAGFLKPTTGRILIDGLDSRKGREQTGFLFQDLVLFPWQTVLEAVMMPLKLKKKNVTKEEYQIGMKLLTEMELANLQDKYPHELSGGQKQRVALARTLIGEPDLLLMDEPTSALDEMTKEQIQRLILHQQQKRNTTMLFVTHDIEEAVYLGEKILILKEDGKVLELENPFFAVYQPKEQLAFYRMCIDIRQLMNTESSYEHTT